MPDLYIYALSIAIGLNSVFFLIAYFLQTDKLTDMTYSLTFIAIALTGYLLSEKTTLHLLVLTIIVLWALRLGGFLMIRVHKLGRDDRFDNIRPYLLKFIAFWTMQAITCFLVSISVLCLFADASRAIDSMVITGALVSIGGLLLETIADYQKYSFKNKYPQKFMSHGVWKKVRHPNYTGEILFWVGLSICAIGSPYWLSSFISPVWIIIILIKFSGIRILRNKWAKKYGKDADYQAYIKRSYNLIPFVY